MADNQPTTSTNNSESLQGISLIVTNLLRIFGQSTTYPMWCLDSIITRKICTNKKNHFGLSKDYNVMPFIMGPEDLIGCICGSLILAHNPTLDAFLKSMGMSWKKTTTDIQGNFNIILSLMGIRGKDAQSKVNHGIRVPNTGALWKHWEDLYSIISIHVNHSILSRWQFLKNKLLSLSIPQHA